MARPEKVASVEEIRSKLGSANAAVLTEYRGLKVAELAALRASLRAADAEYKVFKNTLARRAAQEEGMPELAEMLAGPTAITFVKGDAVSVAKALRDFGRTNPLLVVKGGILGKRVIKPADISALAEIEPREVLLAKIAGAMQAPLVKAAGLFQAMPRNMAYGLKALVDQRVAGGEALPAEKAADEAPAEAATEAPPVAAPAEEGAPGEAAAEEGAPGEAAAEEGAPGEAAAEEGAPAEAPADEAGADEAAADEAIPGTEETPAGTAEGLADTAEDLAEMADASVAAEAPAASAEPEASAQPEASAEDEAPAEAEAATPAEPAAVEEAPTAAEVDGPPETVEAAEEPAAKASTSEESPE